MENQILESLMPVKPRWKGAVGWPCFSPDGQTIVFTDNFNQKDACLMSIPVEGEAEPTILTSRDLAAKRPSWHPNGRTIAFNRDQTSIWTLDLETQIMEPYLAEGSIDLKFVHPCYAPDGESIVVVTNIKGPQGIEGILYRLTPPNEAIPLTRFPEVSAGRAGVSPNGKTIVFAGNAGGFNQVGNQLWTVTSPDKPQRLEAGDPVLCQGRAPRYSPDGKWIAFISTRSTHQKREKVSDWVVDSDGQKNYQLTDSSAVWVVDSRGQQAHQITDSALNPTQVDWAPDQTKLVISSAQCLGLVEVPAPFHKASD